ncbi:MAG: peptidoglycan DD-metalloendopeptidase family protein [Candidatus Hydrogenedentota bacterium]
MKVEALLASAASPQRPAAFNGDARGAGARFDEILTASLGAAQEEAGPSASPLQHTVERGETLSHIVRDYLLDQGGSFRTSDIYSGVRLVAQSNDMVNPDLIRPGKRIDLSALEERLPALAEDASADPEIETAPARVEDVPPMQEAAADASRVEPDSFKEVVATVPPKTAPTIASGEDADEPGSVSSHDSSRLTQRDAALSENVREQIAGLARNLKEVFGGRESAAGVDLGGGEDSPWTAILEQAGRLTSEFGMRESPITGRWQYHRGVDVAAESGTPIYPLHAGQVRFSGWKPGYGNVVIVEHDGRMDTLYGHNSENFVEVGDEVSENTALGAVGATGHATGPHVHFEVRERGRPIDPVPYIHEATGGSPETHAQR